MEEGKDEGRERERGRETEFLGYFNGAVFILGESVFHYSINSITHIKLNI
jgi:hypothetical protein